MDDSAAQFALTLLFARAVDRAVAAASRRRGVLRAAAPSGSRPMKRRWPRCAARRLCWMASRRAGRGAGCAATGRGEPNLRPGLAGALLVPGRFRDLSALRGALAAGARAAPEPWCAWATRVAELTAQGIKLGDGTVLPAGITVCATGAWAPELTPGHPGAPAQRATWSLPTAIPASCASTGRTGISEERALDHADSVAFNVQPRRTGQVLIGSSRQFGAEDTAIDAHMLRRMLQRAVEYMPGSGDLVVIRTWTGFRAATPDKLPLIGPCPGASGCTWRRATKAWASPRRWRPGSCWRTRSCGRPTAIPFEPYLPGRKQEESHG